MTTICVSVIKAAEAVSFSRHTIYRLIKRRQLGAKRIPGVRGIRVSVEELRNLIEKGEAQ